MLFHIKGSVSECHDVAKLHCDNIAYMYICCKLGLRCLIFKRSINSQPSTLVSLIHRVLYWKKVMKQLNVCGGCRFADLYDTYENNSNWLHLSQNSGWTFDQKVWETSTMYPNWRGLEEVSQISLLEIPLNKKSEKMPCLLEKDRHSNHEFFAAAFGG